LPMFWSGKEKMNLLQIIDSLMQESGIEIKDTFRADFMFPKGTKAEPVAAGQRR
jgi:hypothetical protein